ncbi:hypothetical protein FPQ18DRAFT_310986 [Pyronema domesticum]|uniref:Uncharacterized protein n=1 Tax=Pyronema omphalodes (strain CBS 100304) TaxID=1076935 RepID=U4KVL5_PYROM|nr:hypothetical protein FPQ18DRAFT_310986 [Pyronema domesticum]CCX05352.1 Protein of unknown function [Pyronema omphalodes CBS 100304]
MVYERVWPAEVIIPLNADGSIPAELDLPFRVLDVEHTNDANRELRYYPVWKNGQLVGESRDCPKVHDGNLVTNERVMALAHAGAGAAVGFPALFGAGQYTWPVGYPNPIPTTQTSHLERQFLPANGTLVSAPVPLSWDGAVTWGALEAQLKATNDAAAANNAAINAANNAAIFQAAINARVAQNNANNVVFPPAAWPLGNLPGLPPAILPAPAPAPVIPAPVAAPVVPPGGGWIAFPGANPPVVAAPVVPAPAPQPGNIPHLPPGVGVDDAMIDLALNQQIYGNMLRYFQQ